MPCCSPQSVAAGLAVGAGLGVAVGTAVGVAVGAFVGVAEARVVGIGVGAGLAVGPGSADGVLVAVVATAPLDDAQPAQSNRMIKATKYCFRQLSTPDSSTRTLPTIEFSHRK